MSFICKVLKIEFFMSTKFSHLWKLFTDIQSTAVPYRGGFRLPRNRTAADFDRRGTVPRRITITAVPYRGGFRSPRYRTAADFCQISKRRSPWYRTAADFDRRGTVPRRILIAAVPYRGGLLRI